LGVDVVWCGVQRGIDPRQKDVAGNSVYIYAAVHEASWMMDQLIDFLPPRLSSDGQASDAMLVSVDDGEERKDQQRGAAGGGEQSWLEERVEWHLRQPITRAMEAQLDATISKRKEHLDGSVIIDRSKQRDDTVDEDQMPSLSASLPSSPAAPLLNEHQRQIVETMAAACEEADETMVTAIVEVVEDDEWVSRNAAYETCLRALGGRFIESWGTSLLSYLLGMHEDHRDTVKRVIRARPELVLVPNQGAHTETPLEEAAMLVESTSGFDLFRSILITLKRQVRSVIPFTCGACVLQPRLMREGPMRAERCRPGRSAPKGDAMPPPERLYGSMGVTLACTAAAGARRRQRARSRFWPSAPAPGPE
jgi:hypothetical protein